MNQKQEMSMAAKFVHRSERKEHSL